jgi:hypothetical protein
VKRLPLASVLNLRNPVHIELFLKYNFNIILIYTDVCQVILALQISRIKFCTHFSYLSKVLHTPSITTSLNRSQQCLIKSTNYETKRRDRAVKIPASYSGYLGLNFCSDFGYPDSFRGFFQFPRKMPG